MLTNIIDDYDYKDVDKVIDFIIDEALTYIKDESKIFIEWEIRKAYIYSREAHSWQLRLSWDPYITHPVEATKLLLSLKPDIATIQACLLHDVIEDTIKTSEDIEEHFWDDVKFLCEWMEKLWRVRYIWEDRSIWSLRKMFVAMAEDLRVVFIKLADRSHNMKTLKFHPNPEKRERIALETLNIYAPIADRLWLHHFKNDLEEECFKILEPEEYEKISKEFSDLWDSMIIFSKHVEKEIVKLLEENDVKDYRIDYRIKSIYSVYKKMQKKWIDSIKSLYDIFWAIIIIPDETTCYKVLWLVHKAWVPLPKRLKDYIALPKPNWYKSIHTTVIWLLKDYRKQPTEIQIKTYEMKEYSDIWVAAHFEYKEKWSVKATGIDWVKELKDLTSDLENNDFVSSLKIDVFKDRIFVFTPKGDLINLPVWSTSIDFAYYVHSDLWDKITTVKINSEVKTLDKELHNWDVVDIITDKNKKPNPFRLSFVKTAKARNRIKNFLKRENKDLYRERWKEILEKYLEKTWLFELDKDLSVLKVLDWRENKIEERWQVLEQIGNFSIPASVIFKRILKAKNIVIEDSKSKQSNLHFEDNDDKNLSKNKHLIIGWEEKLDYVLWDCCTNWKVPKKMVAHINRNSKITVHKRDCDVVENSNHDRLLSAYEISSKSDFLEVNIVFSVINKRWILKSISDIIYAMDINIEEISYSRKHKFKWDISLSLEISDYDYLIIDRLVWRIENSLWDDLLWFKIIELKVKKYTKAFYLSYFFIF